MDSSAFGGALCLNTDHKGTDHDSLVAFRNFCFTVNRYKTTLYGTILRFFDSNDHYYLFIILSASLVIVAMGSPDSMLDGWCGHDAVHGCKLRDGVCLAYGH